MLKTNFARDFAAYTQDGSHNDYESFLVEWFGWCCCGNTSEGLKAIRDYLAHAASSDNWFDCKTPQDWAFVYFVDSFGLTEHGGGVRGSWLTDDGKEMLRVLDLYTATAVNQQKRGDTSV